MLSFLLFIPLISLSGPELVGTSILLLLLLMGSALVSSSEVAFFSLTHNDFHILQEEDSHSGKQILYLKDKPRKLLATILISNNFINIAIVIVSDYLLRNLLPIELVSSWAEGIINLLALKSLITIEGMGRLINFLFTVVGVTFLLVLFGEVAPKVYAKLNNIRIARFMSGPLFFLMKLFSPLSSILVNWTSVLEKKLEKRRQSSGKTSKKEIDEAIELTVQDEKGANQEINILKSIVKFGDVTAKQIMRSRVDVVAVDFRIPYSELLEVIKNSGYSRIPVYDNDFDNLIGILYAKDLLGHLNEKADYEWKQLARTDIYYVPEAKKIDDLLKEFQKRHLHMAVVVDEYGGSSGIVTLENIMEEVIGEIKDEFDDEPEVVYKKIDDYNYLFEGKTLLNDLCRVVGIDTSTFDENRGDADSIAGLILELTGRMPKVDTVFSYNGFKFKIVSVSKRRIEQVQLTLPK
ncbi:MAG: gliding motility-associated protein GldE [Bacteroidetes bacterium]|nr:gliding motility-associated protein GldE [Bacteroidota bacterium]